MCLAFWGAVARRGAACLGPSIPSAKGRTAGGGLARSFSRACSRSLSPQLGGGKRTLAKEDTWCLGVSIPQVRVLHPEEVGD